MRFQDDLIWRWLEEMKHFLMFHGNAEFACRAYEMQLKHETELTKKFINDQRSKED